MQYRYRRYYHPHQVKSHQHVLTPLLGGAAGLPSREEAGREKENKNDQKVWRGVLAWQCLAPPSKSLETLQPSFSTYTPHQLLLEFAPPRCADVSHRAARRGVNRRGRRDGGEKSSVTGSGCDASAPLAVRDAQSRSNPSPHPISPTLNRASVFRPS